MDEERQDNVEQEQVDEQNTSTKLLNLWQKIAKAREMQYILHFLSLTSLSRPSIINGRRNIQSSHIMFQLKAAKYADKA